MSAARNSFEDNLERLQAIVDQLESGELPLEKGVALYKEGLAAARDCRQALESARVEVEVYQEGLDGEASLKDFEAEDDRDG